jgi:hypothetical protein
VDSFIKIFILKHFIYLLLLICCASRMNAQSGSGWQWASTTGIANASRFIKDITTDAAGNVYATGMYYDTITIAGITLTGTPIHYNHAFTAKYDASGNLIWLNQYKGGAGGVAQSAGVIELDASGNVYIGGTDNGTVGGVGSGFVEKYDNNGNLLWNKVLNLNEVIAINVGPDGNPVVIESLPGYRNIYKLNQADGNPLWTVTNTGSAIPVDAHSSYSRFLDSKGNVYYTLTGFPSGGTSAEVIDGLSVTNQGTTFYFVSLDKNGNRRWIDSASNSVSGIPLSGRCVAGRNNKIYLNIGTSASTGGLSGTNQAATPTSGYYELDTLGKVTSRSFLSPFQNAVKLFVTADAIYSYNTLNGGATGATLSFGDYTFGAPATNATNLGIIVKYDPATYNVLWANSYEATGTAPYVGQTGALDVSPAGNVVIGGFYGSSVKFGSMTRTASVVANNPYTKTDIFVAQFDGASVAPPPSTTWTGAANNANYSDPANWTNGVPAFSKAIIPGGLSNYPGNITTAARIGKLQVDAGATITLPLAISIPSGIVNNGTIELNESGFFYGGFNSGQTAVSGAGKIVIRNNGVYYYGSVVLNNSLEINCTGTVNSLGGTIAGSLILTNGIFGGDITLSNPNASVTGSAAAYVTGKLTRAVNASGTYNFPVGSSNRYTPATLQLNGIAGPQKITASFTNTISGTAPNTVAGGQPVTQLLNTGIWTLTPDVPLTGGSYKVTLEARGFTNSVSDVYRYVVLKRANASSAWGFYGANGAATQTAFVITATAANINGFSDFAIGIASGPVVVVLPVSYNYFTAEKQPAGVELQWQTSSESGNLYFEVQRSADASAWTTIGRVNGRGNADAYRFTDVQPPAGVKYYRLRQVDQNDRFSFSAIRRIYDVVSKGMATIYPNPSNGDSFTLDYNGAVPSSLQYRLVDAGGSTVQSGCVDKRQQTFPLNKLVKGTYFLVLSDGQVISLLKN